MAELEQWGVPLAVAGMLVATLFMAAVVTRYQAHLATVRLAVRRVEVGVQTLLAIFDDLQTVSLSRELRVTLRSDVLARYQKIKKLHKRYLGIAERIAEAETALNAEGAAPGGVGPIEDEQAFRKMLRALDRLIEIVSYGETVQPIPADVRGIFKRELGERRAEVVSRFYMVEAKRYENNGNYVRARMHLSNLMQLLRRTGPSTDFVRELYNEADAALGILNRHDSVDVDATDEGGEPNASVA